MMSDPAGAVVADPTGTTKDAFPEDRCVHDLIADQVARTPDAVALVAGDRCVTYGELWAEARALARKLRGRGVGPGDVVGICLDRGVGMHVAVLGVLTAGAAYLPIDPATPDRRRRFMTRQAGASVVVVDDEQRRHLAGEPVALVDVTEPDGRATGPTVPPSAAAVPVRVPAARPDDLAYVIYTSGSTGTPKGVMVPHRGLCNRIWWAQRRYRLTATDVVLHKTVFTFDVSVWELLWPLVAGSRVVVAEPGGHLSPDHLAETIDRHGVTTVHFVPSMLDQFLAHADRPNPSLRRVLVSGEALRAATVRRFFERHSAELHNLYGPTEASIDVTAWECDPTSQDRSGPPIGRPITNIRIHLLDHRLRPVAPGEPGEIHIGGVGLARGYVGRPAETASRFVPDPFGDVPGARLYRTGDLGRMGPDGSIRFLGRLDDQVKIRGVRIEPSEIEAALVEHADIDVAAVVARGDGGDRRLVAYVVPPPGREAPAYGAIRAMLERTLPAPMIPAAIVGLPSLPVTRNGKLDVAALPAPVVPRGAHVAPATDAERQVAEVWADTLGVPDIGVTENFFELGGHSLLALQICTAIRRRLGRVTSVADLLSRPTVRGFAEAVAGAPRREALPPLRPTGSRGPFPLSAVQRRFWASSRLGPHPAAHNVPIILRLAGPLDVRALQGAVDELVRRHDILRTVYRSVDGEPMQSVLDDARHVVVRTHDAVVPADDLPARLAELTTRPIDLEDGPLLYADLIPVDADAHVLALVTHHIAVDARSVALLKRDLADAYAGVVAGTGSNRPDPVLRYADYAVWERRIRRDPLVQEQIGYWARRLDGAADDPLVRDHPPPRRRSGAGRSLGFELDDDLAAAVTALARDLDATPNAVLLAVFTLLLSALAGRTDVVVGSPVTTRAASQLPDVAGCLLNTVALRIDLGGDPTFAELVARVMRTVSDALDNSDAPFDAVVDALGVRREPDRTPLFQVLFSHARHAPQSAAFGPMHAVDIAPERHLAPFDLALAITERERGMSGVWDHATDVLDAASVEAIHAHYTRLLANCVAAPSARIAALSAEVPRRAASARGAPGPAAVDRSPAARSPAGGAGTVTALPAAAIEAALAHVWTEVLPVARVQRSDNFFDLGGDSVLAVQIVMRTRELGFDLDASALFEHQTVGELAAALAGATTGSAPAGEGDGDGDGDASLDRDRAGEAGGEPEGQPDGTFPVTAAQHGMIFHSLYERAVGMYVAQSSFVVDGELVPTALARALDAVAARHDVLRAGLVWRGVDEPRHVVAPSVRVPWRFLDARRGAPDVADVLAADRSTDFDLSRPPLLRLTIVRTDDQRHHVAVTAHHAVLDGWSTALLHEQMWSAYAAIVAGRPIEAPPGPAFSAHVRWLRGVDLSEADAFWATVLAGLPEPPSLGALRPAAPGPEPVAGQQVRHRRLTPALSAEVRDVLRRRRLTVGALVYTGWAVELSRLAGGHDVVFGATMSGRSAPLPGLAAALGPYASTLPFRVELPHGGSPHDLLTSVQDRMLGVARHEHVPLQRLREKAALPGRAPLFTTTVQVQNVPVFVGEGERVIGEPPLKIRRGRGGLRTSDPLSLQALPTDPLAFQVAFDPAAVDAAKVDELCDDLHAVLVGLVRDDPAVLSPPR